MMQTDWDGVARGYLATEEKFRFIKGLQERNLIVPVVGNFAGPKALRAVGRYIRERGATVSAFYVSNVEQYLFRTGCSTTSPGTSRRCRSTTRARSSDRSRAASAIRGRTSGPTAAPAPSIRSGPSCATSRRGCFGATTT